MKHRGPDDTQLWVQYTNSGMIVIGFHRLSINGINSSANQPLLKNGTVTVCNGEIWNSSDIHTLCNTPNKSGSDCEAIPVYFNDHLDTMASPDDCFVSLCKYIDGVFGLVLYDSSNHKIFVARDPIGIRSLYYATEMNGSDEEGVYVSSEMKGIPPEAKPRPFPPGCWASISTNNTNLANTVMGVPRPYWIIPVPSPHQNLHQVETDMMYTHFCNRLRNCIFEAVRKRVLLSDRSIGCVLSGGLDSTIITSVVFKIQKELNLGGCQIRTYTIGLKDAEDIKWARIAAEYLGSEHHEFVIGESDLLNAIPHVIQQIESYDVTTVRASVGNWLLAKKIAEVGKDTVIFSGDVADELLGGYRGFGLTKDRDAFAKETMKMMTNIHRFDVLRCEKSFSGHGLECRVPFADKDVVDLLMTAPVEYKMWDGKKRIEKECLRLAFQNELPKKLIWRRKEAFSDGISKKTDSWSEIINKHIRSKKVSMPCERKTQTHTHAPPYDCESAYYRCIFDRMYSNPECIPYLWKQPFSEECDPSARCLGNYDIDKDDEEKQEEQEQQQK